MRNVIKKNAVKMFSEDRIDSVMIKFSKLKLVLNYYCIFIISKSKFITGVYYLFSGEFKREQYSVIIGKRVHMEDLMRKRNNYYLLRRNTHRIEKGLLMMPRKDIFATRFITETMNSFIFLLNQNDSEINNNPQFKWTFDVLDKYFKVTADNIIINKERERFNKMTTDLQPTEQKKYVPYKRDLNKQKVISINQFKELSEIRRSVRFFKQINVPRKKIDNAIEIGLLSPSACNRQPFRYQVFDDPVLVKKIGRIPSGTNGFYHNIPMLIAVIGDLSAYPNECDRHLIYIDAALSAMPFMYALEVQGLSSCPLNWPDIEEKEKELDKILSLDKYERVILFIAVGYPDEEAEVAYSMKRELKEMRTFNL
ncbi:nitroreductase family protein [Cohnella lupini]|uniref:Nitroreductase n=1 Tax=Cohnella lupini TaxID=1294267 RepID=A0A3D9IVG9_9BACL|nr:nitroreductase family protein [Cohnella lupini]RED65818.1 nitroreductase [Cohnella lupini]